MIKGGSKYIPLKTLKEIKENQYRTKCTTYDYSSHEIDYYIDKKETDKMLSEHEKLMKMADNDY